MNNMHQADILSNTHRTWILAFVHIYMQGGWFGLVEAHRYLHLLSVWYLTSCEE